MNKKMRTVGPANDEDLPQIPERGALKFVHPDNDGAYRFYYGYYGQVVMDYKTLAEGSGQCNFTKSEANAKIRFLKGKGWYDA